MLGHGNFQLLHKANNDDNNEVLEHPSSTEPKMCTTIEQKEANVGILRDLCTERCLKERKLSAHRNNNTSHMS